MGEAPCDGCLSVTLRRAQAGIDSSRYDTVGSVWSRGEILARCSAELWPRSTRKSVSSFLSPALLLRTKPPLALRYAPSFRSFVRPILACCPIRTKHKAKLKKVGKNEKQEKLVNLLRISLSASWVLDIFSFVRVLLQTNCPKLERPSRGVYTPTTLSRFFFLFMGKLINIKSINTFISPV